MVGSIEKPEITWITEEQLVPVRQPSPRGRVGLMTQLLDAQNADERQRLVRGMLHAIGFDWLAYGKVSLQRGQLMPQSFFSSYAHPEWTRLYFAERLYEVDPRHRDASPSGLPMAWDVEELALRPAASESSVRQRRFVELMRASGIRSGVFITLPSALGPLERTVISLSSSAPERGWIADSVLGQAAMLGLCLHEYLSAHVQLIDKTYAGNDLSPMQQEILRGLAMGQSDKEIAYWLNLSTHTVDYHMRRLRQRFCARNRAQLVHALMRRTEPPPAACDTPSAPASQFP